MKTLKKYMDKSKYLVGQLNITDIFSRFGRCCLLFDIVYIPISNVFDVCLCLYAIYNRGFC